MIKRRELSQVYYLDKELKMWEQKLEELQQSVDAIGSPSNADVTGIHGTKKTDRTAELAMRISDTQVIIRGLMVQIRTAQRNITRIVSEIDDSLLRQIVMYRCYDLMSWQDVAEAIGSSEYAVKHMFYRAFPD